MNSFQILQLIRASFRISIGNHLSWIQYSIQYERSNYSGYFHTTSYGDYYDDLDIAIQQSIVNHFNHNNVTDFMIKRDANLLYLNFAENIRIAMSGSGFGYDTNGLNIYNQEQRLLITAPARICFNRRGDELVDAMIESILPRSIQVQYQPDHLKQILQNSFLEDRGRIGDPFIIQ